MEPEYKLLSDSFCDNCGEDNTICKKCSKVYKVDVLVAALDENERIIHEPDKIPMHLDLCNSCCKCKKINQNHESHNTNTSCPDNIL